jgi:hypothetical protein
VRAAALTAGTELRGGGLIGEGQSGIPRLSLSRGLAVVHVRDMGNALVALVGLKGVRGGAGFRGGGSARRNAPASGCSGGSRATARPCYAKMTKGSWGTLIEARIERGSGAGRSTTRTRGGARRSSVTRSMPRSERRAAGAAWLGLRCSRAACPRASGGAESCAAMARVEAMGFGVAAAVWRCEGAEEGFGV